MPEGPATGDGDGMKRGSAPRAGRDGVGERGKGRGGEGDRAGDGGGGGVERGDGGAGERGSEKGVRGWWKGNNRREQSLVAQSAGSNAG